MFDPLLELQVILGVFFWLALHQLLVLSGQRRTGQRGLERRHRKATYPPLPGLLAKPHCAHCADDSLSCAKRVPYRPPLISSSRGRPRQVKTEGHYCPNSTCTYYGWLNRGNIRANGRPNSRVWRQLHARRHTAGTSCLWQTVLAV